MTVDWQEFERLVARIEQTVAPAGAVVTSPDFVTDLVTGSRRQIDATIRYKIGTVPVLITIECRKHEDVQDDTWLEQLVTKKQKVGAAKTIAVSSSGFTGPSKTTARMNGIEVRTVSEITAEDITSWLRIDAIEQVIDGMELVSFRCGVYGGQVSLHPDIIQAMEADGAGAPIFTRVADGHMLSVRDVVSAAQQAGLKLHEGLPHDGSHVRRDLSIPVPDQIISILTEDGPRFLQQLLLGIDVFTERTLTPLPPGFDYSDTQASLVRGTEHRLDLPEHDCIVTVCREPDSDEIKFNLMIRKKPEEEGPDESVS